MTGALLEIRNLTRELRTLTFCRDELRAVLESAMGMKFEKIRVSMRIGNPFEDKVLRLVDLDARIKKIEDRKNELSMDLIEILTHLSDRSEAEILKLSLIDGLTDREIAEKISYSLEFVRKRRRSGAKKISGYYEKSSTRNRSRSSP